MPLSQKRYGRGRASITVSGHDAVGKHLERTKSPSVIGFQPPKSIPGADASPPPAPQRPEADAPHARPPQAAQAQSLATKPCEPGIVAMRQRIRLADALRRCGIDEQKIAALYAYLVETLEDRLDERGVEKLLIDVLKECSRLFAKENAPAKSEWRAASIPIVVHNIPRPERGPQTGGDNNGTA